MTIHKDLIVDLTMELIISYCPDLQWQYKKIVESWTEPHRHYHDINHLHSLIEAIDHSNWSLQDRKNLILAAVYHDIIYDTHRNDNEERSAQMFHEDIEDSISGGRMVVQSIILDTKVPIHQELDKSNTYIYNLSTWFRKIDYGYAFTMDPKKYEDSIRKEYDWIMPDVYLVNRLGFLTSVVDIYPSAQEVIDYLKSKKLPPSLATEVYGDV